MRKIIDVNYGIPYFTNDSDQIFSWYTIYDDGVIILEKGLFSNVNFNNIPKANIKYFGLFGCGMHLTCNFKKKSIYIYNSYNENEFLYQCKYNLNENIKNNNLIPFQFKGFIYDTPINNSHKDNFFINSFYLGWKEDILINNVSYINKIYFSIDIFKHPNSVGLIYKLTPKDNFYPQNIKYKLSISDFNASIINGIQKITNNTRNVTINSTLKYKTIFKFNIK